MNKILITCWIVCCLAAHGAEYVVAVSVDGLGSSYLEKLVDAGTLPHFKRLQAEAAGTTNARTDVDITVTLPNHTCMVTGRGIKGPDGHNWTSNTDPAKGMTIHSNKGTYVSAVFERVHDHALRTGVWATKSKFALFKISYDEHHGAPDTTGPDNGRNKVDTFVCDKSPALTDRFIACMTTQPCHFAFVHFGDADGTGHTHGWGSKPYDEAIMTIDGYLGRIMDLLETNPVLKGKTTLIVTADHGGKEKGHGEAEDPLNYTIPFYVWGAGVTPGDLYALNALSRQSPAGSRPPYSAPVPPIRNGDVGNLALSLLTLPPIPGSTINVKQDLKVGAVP